MRRIAAAVAPAVAEPLELDEQAERDEIAAWREAELERLLAAFEAALPELEKWWQEQRDERNADADVKAWQRERDERLIAEYEAAEARELQRRPEPGARRIRVGQPRARRRGAGRPAGRRTSTASTGADSSDPEPEHALAARAAA